MAKRVSKTEKPVETPTHEAIARRAYEIYVESGCIDGRDMENWLRAEQELRTPPLQVAIKPVTRTVSRISLRNALSQRA